MRSVVHVDVAVVGGGPGGLSAAIHAARRGYRVLILEKNSYPHEKICGDGLSPLAIGELSELGLDLPSLGVHRIDGLRIGAYGTYAEVPWPDMRGYPNWGACLRRRRLDHAVAHLARQSGVEIWEQTEGLEPIATADRVHGILARNRITGEITAVKSAWTVLADGATCPASRRLGIIHDPDHSPAAGLRSYLASSCADEPYMTIFLDVCNPAGGQLSGYGWIFPLGDGMVNVGLGFHPKLPGTKGVVVHALWESFLNRIAGFRGLGDVQSHRPEGWTLPMGRLRTPVAGAGFLVVGDAAAMINPLNGEGVAHALHTGRVAATTIDRALRGERDLDASRRYQREVRSAYQEYYRAGTALCEWIDRFPNLWRWLLQHGLLSNSITQELVRIVTGLPRRDLRGWERLLLSLSARFLFGRSPPPHARDVANP